MSAVLPEPSSPWEPLSYTVDFGTPAMPCDDEFYRPPAGFEVSEPGAVLRARRVEIALLGLVRQKVVAFQLLCRTTDLNGSPQATVVTVMQPAVAALSRTAPVVAYQCAIDSLVATGAPSYALRHGAKLRKILGGPPAMEYLFMACALSRGWRVVVTDHGGTRGCWTAPREPGHTVLDGLRAAHSFGPAEIDSAAPIALWGYSGGGLASGWAAELWHSYAPDLNIVGAVLGAPVGDPAEIFKDLDGTLWAGLPALALVALMREYPSLQRIVLAHTSPEGRALLDALPEMGMIGALVKCSFRAAARHLDCTLDEILSLPELVDVFDDLRLGSAAPAMPVLILQAIRDQVIHVRHIDALVGAYRRQGAAVSYLRDKLSEHALLFPLSVPYALSWLAARLTTESAPSSGDRETRLALSPKTLSGFGEIFTVAVKVAFGRPLFRTVGSARGG